MAYDAYGGGGGGGGDSYNTGYGAQGGAAGGGFVAGDVSSSPAGDKGGYGKDTVRPLTIKQILEAQHPHAGANFRVDGDEITQITFVGQIRSISSQTTNVTYKVDDGTGIVEVKQWVDSDSATGDQMDMDHAKPKLLENGYCRVWGRLKDFNNKRHVGAHVIRPVTDYNEINYHFLEATAIHLFFTKGPPTGDATHVPHGAAANGARAGGPDLDVTGRPMPSVTPMARRVYNALKNAPQVREGLHVQMVASQLGVGVNEAQKAGEELTAAGLCYTTIDNDTWAVTDF